MRKDYKVSILLDYYGALLTEKQYDMLSLYYNEDLSLSEIAENEGISRQGVYDAVKRAEEQLLLFEEKIGYAKACIDFNKFAENIEKIAQNAKNQKKDISAVADEIISAAEKYKNRQ